MTNLSPLEEAQLRAARAEAESQLAAAQARLLELDATQPAPSPAEPNLPAAPSPAEPNLPAAPSGEQPAAIPPHDPQNPPGNAPTVEELGQMTAEQVAALPRATVMAAVAAGGQR